MVVDVRLPGMSGFELYNRLKKDPRIATYVKKPFDLSAVVAYVKRLATSASLPPGSALPPRA